MKAKEYLSGRFVVLYAVLLVLLFQAGFGGPDTANTDPAAPAGQEATAKTGPTGKTLANGKYGYELVVPAGWQSSTMDGQGVSTTAHLFLTGQDEQQLSVKVAAGTNGGIVADEANNFRTLRSTKQQFTALGGEGMLFRLARSTAADTRRWAEYHFVATRNGFTFDISTEVPEDRETLPAYFQEVLSGWRWLAPDTSLAALGTPGDLGSIKMLNDTQGWGLARGKILRTEDGGEHWAAVTPPGLAGHPWVVGTEFLDADHAWLSVRSKDEQGVAVFRTADGGRSWAETTVRQENRGLVYGGQLDFIDPVNGWLLIEPEHGMSSRPGELYRTTDGGEHWSELARAYGSPAENGLPFSGPFSFRDSITGWICGQQGAAFSPDHPLYMTTDGGRTWRPQDLPLPAGRTNGKLDVNAPPEFYPAGGRNGVLPVLFIPGSYKTSDYATLFYTTGDGGRAWQARGSLPGTGPASFQSAVNWWAWRDDPGASGLAAPVRGTLYHTNDGGGSWTAIAPGGDLARALEKGEKVQQLDFVTEKTGWLLLETVGGKGTELLQTTDGGTTWQLVQ
ncbi:MAG: WD40/YVTN/BNR-like repeat-containing protein [Syntrophothermus sp.]